MDEVFYEIFEALPRQGPGDDASTKRAFQKLKDLPDNPAILDVGCGNGSQTLALAKLTSGKITALDNHAPFIDILKKKARRAGYTNKIHCIVGDMGAMDFKKGSFDLIWSEGAIFVIGFKRALDEWQQFLRHAGFLVTSELVWFKKRAPSEIRKFFIEHYPDMKHYRDHLSMMESSGYKIIGYFPLPGESWWQNYYIPAEGKIAELRVKYQGNDEAKTVFDSFQLEIDMFSKYSEYYGYYFYIMQKARTQIGQAAVNSR